MADQVLVVVQFIRPHRHAGKYYKPGDRAEVTAKAAKKLSDWGVIKE